MTWAIYTLIGVPLAAVLLSLIDGWRLARAATVIAGCCSLGLAIAIALHVSHGDRTTAAGGWLQADSLSAVFLLGTGLLYAMAAVFSVGYLDAGDAAGGTTGEAGGTTGEAAAGFAKRYHALLNLFALVMLLVPLAADFGSLWVAVELTTIVSALLVALERTQGALEAAWKYVLIASSGLGIALLATIVLYAAGTHALGTAYIPRFADFLGNPGGLGIPRDAIRAAFVLAVVGFGTKVGFVPMHTWLPDAHSEAPAPVSAMLSGSLLSSALYAVLRFFQVATGNGNGPFAQHVLIVFGVISLLTASFFVLRQANYKRLLAYSSIEHMAIIALGIGFGAPLAVAGALLHVLTHASAKGLAFLGAGSLLRGYDTKEVESVRGAGRAMPWTGPLFLIAALALSGLPVSGVFRSEFEIVAGGFSSGQDVGVALLLVFVNLAFLGVIWHAGGMVLGPAPDGAGVFVSAGREGSAGRERSVWMIAAMLGALFVVVALGVHLPGQLSALLQSAGRELRVPAR